MMQTLLPPVPPELTIDVSFVKELGYNKSVAWYNVHMAPDADFRWIMYKLRIAIRKKWKAFLKEAMRD